MSLRRLHVYEARDAAFEDDDVLQENVIIHGVKSPLHPEAVEMTSTVGPHDSIPQRSVVPYEIVVHPDDPDCFIHFATETDRETLEQVKALPCSLADLDLAVSTGRVVDFRATQFLRDYPSPNTVPLIYPTHLKGGGVSWPKAGRKPNAILSSPDTSELLVPNANYVLVKRFSAKEERRRVVSCVYDATNFDYPSVGFENHLNYFHQSGSGLPLELARGLSVFLNSSLIDRYFRLFSGHTQVNAADLRRLRYPTRSQLQSLADTADADLGQLQIDRLIATQVLSQIDRTK
jgi:adenine-specific DNA-methyltransferase